MRFAPIRFRHSVLEFDRPYIAGVVNVTPDSFSDGGALASTDDAIAFGLRLVEAGADLLDVGGESTRPQRAQPVTAEEEMRRVVPVIRGLAARAKVPISVDTTKAAVAEAAVEVGAEVVNDISGGRFDPAVIDVAARRGAAYVLGHVQGQDLAAIHAAESEPPSFLEVAEELVRGVLRLPLSLRMRTLVDPGIGFGKRTRENLELLRRAGELGAATGRPVMVGPSRKRFIGELSGRPVGDRDDATVGACLAAVAAGANVLRVHDVKRLRDALVVFWKVQRIDA
jgi:dihydropteroate synthase